MPCPLKVTKQVYCGLLEDVLRLCAVAVCNGWSACWYQLTSSSLLCDSVTVSRDELAVQNVTCVCVCGCRAVITILYICHYINVIWLDLLQDCLITIYECKYLVRHGHFRSCGACPHQSIAKKPMLHIDFTALSSIEPQLNPIEVLRCVNRDFCTFYSGLWTCVHPVTWSTSSMNLTRIPCRPKMSFLCQGFWKLSYYIHTESSVVKSRWLCYFQESRSTCQKFYFLESRSSVKIFYFLESRK